MAASGVVMPWHFWLGLGTDRAHSCGQRKLPSRESAAGMRTVRAKGLWVRHREHLLSAAVTIPVIDTRCISVVCVYTSVCMCAYGHSSKTAMHTRPVALLL